MANQAVERLRVDRRSLDLYAVPEIPALDSVARQRVPGLGQFYDQLVWWRGQFNSGLRDKLLALTELQQIQDSIGNVLLQVKDVDSKSAAKNREQDDMIGDAGDRISKLETYNTYALTMINTINNYVDEVKDRINTISRPDWQLYTFAAPVTPWSITHTLRRFVAVTLFDVSGNQFTAHVNQPSTTTVTVTLSGSLAGSALLS